MRTTEEQVRAISDIDTNLTDLTPFLTAANLIVTKACPNIDELYPDDAVEVERWLAAHIITIRDPKAQSEGVSGMSASYQGTTGMGLQSSFYGQQAMLLDPTGGLAKWNRLTNEGKTAKKVSVSWIGSAE